MADRILLPKEKTAVVKTNGELERKNAVEPLDNIAAEGNCALKL